MDSATKPPHFVTLGMFIIDEFYFLDEEGKPTGKILPPQESLQYLRDPPFLTGYRIFR